MTPSKLQQRGSGAKPIELEKRLDRNSELIDRTRQALPPTAKTAAKLIARADDRKA